MHKQLSRWFIRYLSDPEAITILIGLALAVLVLKTMGSILAPLLAGVVIAYMLSGLVKRLDRWHCPHLLSVILVYLFFIGLLILVLLWLLPLLWQQLVNLFSSIPAMVNHGQSLLIKLHQRYPDIVSVGQLNNILSQITSYLANLSQSILAFSLASIMNIVTIVVYLVLVPFLVFFFMRDDHLIIVWATKFLPHKKNVMRKIWDEVNLKIGSYIRGKALELLIVAVVSIIAFEVLGLNYAILLGVLVGVSVVIPYVGIAVVTVPIVIVSLIQWGFTAEFWYLMLVYVIIVTLDANILVPMLFAEAMNLHPVAIIMAVLIFGSLAGFWGIFFAIPLMTLVNALLKFWPCAELQE